MNINESKISRMKTVKQCFEEIKKIDPETATSQWFIRCLCKENRVKHFIAGKSKILVNYDDLIKVLNFEPTEELKNNEEDFQ